MQSYGFFLLYPNFAIEKVVCRWLISCVITSFLAK